MANAGDPDELDDLPFHIGPTPDLDFQIPDLAEATQGWRSWKVSGEVPSYGVTPKLYSVSFNNFFWAPRRVNVAHCDRCGDDTPQSKCHCGFYSARSFEHLMSLPYRTYDGERSGMYCVIGRVANWGNVIEGTLGWRAQKSYPIELFVPYEIWEMAPALKEAYGVPVGLKNWLKERS